MHEAPSDSRRGFKPFGRSARHGFTRPRRSATYGFTLIEVMVALAVFSLAALALLKLEGATIRGAGAIDDTLVANLVARNLAIDAITDAAPPAIGDEAGRTVNGGTVWRWTRHVAPTGNAAVLRIDVAVAAPSGQVLGRTTAVRATPPAPAATPIASPTAVAS